MYSLVDKLFTESQSKAIKSLLEDNDSKHLIEREIGKKIIEYDRFLKDNPIAQITFITSLSTFADSSNECYDVANIINWGIKRIDIIPMITEHNGREFAYRCLVSLGLFKKAMIMRTKRYGSPSIEFYREAGSKTFYQIGMNNVGNHFYKWENFIGEIFTL